MGAGYHQAGTWQDGGFTPWVTECVTCARVACRGFRQVCGILSRRTPKGRLRHCQGRLFRRHDIEDAIRAAYQVGGREAADAMIASLVGGL
jgi:hypothetical protein